MKIQRIAARGRAAEDEEEDGGRATVEFKESCHKFEILYVVILASMIPLRRAQC